MTEPDTLPVYSIGHSTHSLDRLVELLSEHGVSAVADVRSTPYSRWQPHFNRESLRGSLAGHGIAYVFLGVELGGRGADESVRDAYGRTLYRKIAKTASFRGGMRRVREGSRRMRLALLCVESDPLECHRGILVSRAIAADGGTVQHIHADGHVESHRDAEQRLLRLTMPQEWDLMRTPEQIIADAYDLQGSRIAYVMTSASAGG